MKTRYFKTLLLIIFIVVSSQLLSQGPPNPPGDPSSGGGPVGGSAPIGSGIGILITLGAAYGGRKVYRYFSQSADQEDDKK
ncbi:MAG: hypothetical protein H3C41_09990 [Bacteroidales bacterium]|nr:hypothetical protein [Bacteroidales bacterium]